jgi:hypothetical protein
MEIPNEASILFPGQIQKGLGGGYIDPRRREIPPPARECDPVDTRDLVPGPPIAHGRHFTHRAAARLLQGMSHVAVALQTARLHWERAGKEATPARVESRPWAASKFH